MDDPHNFLDDYHEHAADAGIVAATLNLWYKSGDRCIMHAFNAQVAEEKEEENPPEVTCTGGVNVRPPGAGAK